MATAEDSGLLELVECAVCLSPVNNHRELPCQHIYCQSCLEKLVKHDSILCPVCRKPCYLDGKPVDSLPKNLLLVKVLDQLCEKCKRGRRSVRCSHCASHLCLSCHKTCQAEIEKQLEILQSETVQQLVSGQSLSKYILEETQKINEEVSKATNLVDQSLETIMTMYKSLKSSIQEKGKREQARLQSRYDDVNNQTSKVLECLDKHQHRTKLVDPQVDPADCCKKWQKSLSDLREAHSLIDIKTTVQILVEDLVTEKNHFSVGKVCIKHGAETRKLRNDVVHKLKQEIGLPALVAPDLSTSNSSPHTPSDITKDSTGAESEVEEGLPSTASMTTESNTREQNLATANPIERCQRPIDYSAEITLTSVFRGNGELRRPSFVAIAHDPQNILVSDTDNCRIQMLDKKGQYMSSFGSEGSYAGQFGFGEWYAEGGITVTSEVHIVVSDSKNNRLQVFDKRGRFMRIIGNQGNKQGELIEPLGLARDEQDHIYVCDNGNCRIQVFDVNGRSLKIFGARSRMGDWSPCGIAVWPDGTTVVADHDNDKKSDPSGSVNIFNPNGQLLKTIKSAGSVSLRNPRDVTIDADGNMVVTDSSAHCVHVFQRDGCHLTTFGSKGKGRGQFMFPTGVVCPRPGEILVVDQTNNRLHLFSCG